MTEAAQVVIIGAGFAGAATAYHLAKRGVRDVIVLEAEASAGVHASGKNAALCFQTIDDREEAELAIEGTRIYAAPPEDLSPEPLLERNGSLLLASEAGRPALEKSHDAARALGVGTSIVSRAEAIARVPLLRHSPFECALDNPEDGVVDIRRLLDTYLEAAKRGGAKVRFGETVRAIHAERGRIESVATERGTIATRSLVNAAGAWAGEVARLAGIASSISPRRRHIFEATAPVAIDRSWPFVWHAEIDVYFRPHAGGILTSACDATPHDPHAPSVDPAAEATLRDKLGRAFPAVVPPRVTAVRACLRTFSRDEHFLIGRDPEIEGFVWVAALGGHGVSTSYGVGRLGASALLGEESTELESFSPKRLSGSIH
ncbi:MAG: NAD(P)/FAD-dependent oxidoreductase [Candidatus Binatia bacterium]